MRYLERFGVHVRVRVAGVYKTPKLRLIISTVTDYRERAQFLGKLIGQKVATQQPSFFTAVQLDNNLYTSPLRMSGHTSEYCFSTQERYGTV